MTPGSENNAAFVNKASKEKKTCGSSLVKRNSGCTGVQELTAQGPGSIIQRFLTKSHLFCGHTTTPILNRIV